MVVVAVLHEPVSGHFLDPRTGNLTESGAILALTAWNSRDFVSTYGANSLEKGAGILASTCSEFIDDSKDRTGKFKRDFERARPGKPLHSAMFA